MQRYFLIFFSLFFFVAMYVAAESVFDEGDPVKVELFNEETSFQPGRPMWIALRVSLEKTWHTYWKNPGDTGMPIAIEWDLPEGFAIEHVEWPYPKRYTLNTIIGYGYEDEAIFLAKISTPKTPKSQSPVSIAASVKWLACSDSTCLPGESQAKASLFYSPEEPCLNVNHVPVFTKGRLELPKKEKGFSATRKNNQVEVHLTGLQQSKQRVSTAYFAPESGGMIDEKAEATVVFSDEAHDRYHLTFKDAAENKSPSLKGVLVLEGSQGKQAYEINLPLSEESDNQMLAEVEHEKTHVLEDLLENRPPQAEEFEGGFIMALVLAFLGGLILNLMPCVLPVISFKVLSFAKVAGKSRALCIKHGLAFSFGVLLSFWILAGVLLALQAYGQSVGWGFQLQEPVFVAALAAVIFIFSLSLFGVFELGTRVASIAGQTDSTTRSSGLWGSFFSGILATAVATPCTGPFLGSAVGYAVTLTPVWALLIFTALGLGMAFPYLILGIFPKFLKFMPKPGPWMVTFKEIMGFLMLATVLWLLWVFGAQTPNLSLLTVLGSFFIFALGCWAFGRWGTPVNNRLTRVLTYCFLVFCLFVGGQMIWTASYLQGSEAEDEEIVALSATPAITKADVWESYSPERVKELHKQGTPVFIDFTAKWCLICQANRMVLSQPSVVAKFKEAGVVKMKADWTRKDPMIAKELRKYGRSGVPLYLLFDKDPSAEAYLLPQVLTPELVIKALDEIKDQPTLVEVI